MSFFSFGRKSTRPSLALTPPAEQRVPTAAERLALAPPVALTTALVSAGRGALIERFVDVGDFQRLLSEGTDAVYAVPSALADQLLALDLGAKRAVVVIATTAGVEPSAEMVVHLRSLKLNLRAEGYELGADRPALPLVIRDIRRNPGQRTHNSGKGGPLELFSSWVNIAEFMGGSDMHCEIRGQRATVRVRVDGLLVPLEDGNEGRHSAKEAEDAMGAGYNSTRKGVSGSQWIATELVSCMIGFNTPRASGQLRYQNLPGRLGPKVVVRILRTETQEVVA